MSTPVLDGMRKYCPGMAFYVGTLARPASDATWTRPRHARAFANAELVRQVADLCDAYGRRPATVEEARRMLRLPPSTSAGVAA